MTGHCRKAERPLGVVYPVLALAGPAKACSCHIGGSLGDTWLLRIAQGRGGGREGSAQALPCRGTAARGAATVTFWLSMATVCDGVCRVSCRRLGVFNTRAPGSWTQECHAGRAG